mmetsp:Transcript_21442/g.55004  ORF Transcript_21442/g.55004 Transcript_21442/m.55004 type:complete len:224 (+) Transcript_21442:1519-2190(+)
MLACAPLCLKRRRFCLPTVSWGAPMRSCRRRTAWHSACRSCATQHTPSMACQSPTCPSGRLSWWPPARRSSPAPAALHCRRIVRCPTLRPAACCCWSLSTCAAVQALVAWMYANARWRWQQSCTECCGRSAPSTPLNAACLRCPCFAPGCNRQTRTAARRRPPPLRLQPRPRAARRALLLLQVPLRGRSLWCPVWWWCSGMNKTAAGRTTSPGMLRASLAKVT